MLSLSKLTRTAVLGLTLAALTLPTRAADLDKLAPGDAEAALVINVKNFLESKLFKKYGDEAFDAALKNEKAAEFIKATGLDLRKDLTSITVCGPLILSPTEAKGCVIVKGNFNVAKLQTAIEDGAKKDGEKLKVTKEGGLTYYTITPKQGNQEITGTFIGNDSILISNNADYLKTIAAGKKIDATAASKTLKGAIASVGGKETVVLGVAITDDIKKAMAQSPQFKQYAEKLEAVTGTVNVGEAVDIALGINMTDADTAKALGQLIKTSLPILNLLAAQNEQAKPAVDLLVKNLKIGSEGKAVSLKLQLTEELMKSLQPVPPGN
jgi:hypothetical protein